MLLALLALLAVLAQTPDGGKAPSPRELAQLFFLAGDLRRAVELGKRCVELEGKPRCMPFYRALVDYESLILRNEHLSRAEAKAYLEYDHLISPQQEGKLTAPVRQRYVTDPLAAAQRALDSGERDKALALVNAVLEVEPANGSAKTLRAQLDAGR
jgi:hypothetical protein